MRHVGNEAIARMAPDIFEHFKERGLVEFHALPTEPPVLLVSVQYLGSPTCSDDLDFLRSLATAAGFTVERGCTFEETLVIEVALDSTRDRPQTGVVVPFRRPRSDRFSPTA